MLGDLTLAATLAINAWPILYALARWQGRLLPYLPHLPLEVAAAAVASAVWLRARRGHTLGLVRAAVLVLALLAGAAMLETFATPHLGGIHV